MRTTAMGATVRQIGNKVNGAKRPRRTVKRAVSERPTSWWLAKLRHRAEGMYDEKIDLSEPIVFSSEAERDAAIRFFNAAYRAEESGIQQAHLPARAYTEQLAALFMNEEDFGFRPPRFLMRLLGLRGEKLERVRTQVAVSVAAAEAAADRSKVVVSAL